MVVVTGARSASASGTLVVTGPIGERAETAETAMAVAPLTVAAITLPTFAATMLPVTPRLLDPSMTVRVIVDSGPLPA